MITLRRIAAITVLVVLVLIAHSSVTGQGRNFNNATQIQGVNISTVAPTNTQVLEYIAATKLWTPTTGGGGGGCTPGGTINYVLLDSGSGTCNTSTTLSDNGTTLTYTGTGGITASGGPITAGGTTSGVSMVCTTAATPVSGQVGITPPATCSNYGNYNLSALPASAGIWHVAATSSNVSAVTVGPIVGTDMANATVTATQLAAQYSKGSCTEVWGGSGTSFAMTSGDDAIANNSCYNDSGVTRTITALKCRGDNSSNSTVLTPTFGSAGTGTAILTGTVTCGNSYAYSATGTLANTAWTTGTGIDPGMSTVGNATSIAMIVEYTF